MLPSLAEVSEVAGAQHRSSSAEGAKGSSRRGAEPPLKFLYLYLEPFGAKRHAFPSDTGRCGK